MQNFKYLETKVTEFWTISPYDSELWAIINTYLVYIWELQ